MLRCGAQSIAPAVGQGPPNAANSGLDEVLPAGHVTISPAGPAERAATVDNLARPEVSMRRVQRIRVLAAIAACAAPFVCVADDGTPDWLRRQSRSIADLEIQPPDEYLVVLQRDRADGAELLTLRMPLATFDSVLAYAGAGVNRTTYLEQPDFLAADSGGRHRSIGAAAELGAEWRVGENLAMSADLRWIDLASDADFLRNGESLVAADSVALGFSLGWRFR